MAFTNIGCITATPLFATQLWQAGTKPLGPVVLPDKYRGGMILIDVSQLTNLLAVLTVNIQVTQDGQNYVEAGGFELSLPNSGYTLSPGLVDQVGDPVRVTGMNLRFPESSLLTRQIKGTVSLSAPAVIGMTMVIW